MINNLSVFGINHKIADSQKREIFAKQVDLLLENISVTKFVKLHTSNRVEYYFLSSSSNIQEIYTSKVLTINSNAYFYPSSAALKHLSIVYLGLDSEKIGETSIKNQIKNAFIADKNDSDFEIKNDIINIIKKIVILIKRKFNIKEFPSSIPGQVLDKIRARFDKSVRIKICSNSKLEQTLCTKLLEHKYEFIDIQDSLKNELPERLELKLKPFSESPSVIICDVLPSEIDNNCLVFLLTSEGKPTNSEMIFSIKDLESEIDNKKNHLRMMTEDIKIEIDKLLPEYFRFT